MTSRTSLSSTVASPSAENAPVQISDAANALGSVDPTVYGRAAAAYAAEFARWQNGIDALQKDQSLTPEQRTVAIKALQTAGKITADAIRRRIIEDEMQRARHARQRVRTKGPKPPSTPSTERLR